MEKLLVRAPSFASQLVNVATCSHCIVRKVHGWFFSIVAAQMGPVDAANPPKGGS